LMNVMLLKEIAKLKIEIENLKKNKL